MRFLLSKDSDVHSAENPHRGPLTSPQPATPEAEDDSQEDDDAGRSDLGVPFIFAGGSS